VQPGLWGLHPIGVNVTVSWLWGGQSQTCFFLLFSRLRREKRRKKDILGDAIPQTPALQSGKPRKLTHMGCIPRNNWLCGVVLLRSNTTQLITITHHLSLV
jgi:hypothetical protein